MPDSRVLRLVVGLAVAAAAVPSAPGAAQMSRPASARSAASPAVPASPAAAASPAPAQSDNPFFAPSPLPFQAPDFDRIRDAHFQPALEEGMRRQLEEVRAIAGQSAAPTFDNTIVALERSGRMLTRVANVFFALTSANTDDTLQAVQAAEAPKLAAHADAIYMDDALFRRVKSIYDRRASLGLDAEQTELVERYYRDFVRAGALLSDADKAELRGLNQEISKLTTEYQKRLLAATKAGAVVVTDSSELAGLDDGAVAAAAQAARRRGLQAGWVITLQNTTQQPAQAELQDRALRERLFRASTQRAEHGDANDTRLVVQRLARLRAQKAKLLGYDTWAAYSLADQNARTPAAAIGLLEKIAPAATARARAEAADMQALIRAQGGDFQLQPWDWQYYAEQVRRQKYALDESRIKPYFELNRVLEDGVFFAANRLYGITFHERTDIPVYAPDVRVFEVRDADGTPLALFYCDYYARDNKRGGAWMSDFVGQSRLLGTRPVVFNVANFPKPAPGQPALLTFDDVSTMFHEFGHALHGMFSSVEYPSLSGTNVPRDFVEFPSQFNEHWALDPEVFAHYARHYETGAPMPAALVAKIRKARTFNQGFATTELVAASLLDMAWHTLPADAPLQPVDSFEAAALRRYHVDVPQVPPRYRTTYFAHIWASGYAAGYYAYLWSEVLDNDAYAWFTEHGGLTRANGQRLRDMVLSRGSTGDTGAMYRAFAGRDPSIEPLLEARGLKGQSGSK